MKRAGFTVVPDLRCSGCGRGNWKLSAETRRHNSSTALASCRVCGARLFLKSFRGESPTEARQAAVEQFRLAGELFASAHGEYGFRVPRPLALHGSTIAMEYADAEPASLILRGGSEEIQDQLLERMGLWFASYHRAMACEDGPTDFDEKCESLRTRAQGLRSDHPA